MGERRLLELKARRTDLTEAEAWCTRNATPIEDIRQADTYFRVERGRLKLRMVEGENEGTLIYYRRDDRPAPKRSRVFLLSVADPVPLLELLREALGIRVEVRKRRRIFRWGEVQVHLDEVDGLGTFLEFERMVDSKREERQAEVEFSELRTSLGIAEEDLMAGSYGDMDLESDTEADKA